MNNSGGAEDHGAVSRYTVSFGISLAIASIVNALLVIAKETNEASLLVWMRKATGHDWATQTLFLILLFVGLGLILARGRGPRVSGTTLVRLIVAAVSAGALIIVGFFLLGT
jgi:hypothetical protein